MTIAAFEASLWSPSAPPLAASSHCSLFSIGSHNVKTPSTSCANSVWRSLNSWLPRQSCSTRTGKCIHANAETDGAARNGNIGESRAQSTMEQGKRILALQKELLDQIAERKKLMTALKENLASTTEQIKAYNESKDTKRGDSTHQDKRLSNKSGDNPRRSPMPDKTAVPPIVKQPYVSSEAQKLKDVETVKVPKEDIDDFLSTAESSSLLPLPLRIKELPLLKKIEDVFQSRIDKVSQSDGDEDIASEPLLKETSRDVAEGISGKKSPPLAGPNVMNIILVAAECAPWSKTGGLGDVAGALPKALARRGHRVMVVAPRYSIYKEAWNIGVRKRYIVAGQDMEVTYFHTYIDGVDYVFIDNPVFSSFANDIYGGKREDILKRMVLFCKAAVEVPWHVPCGGVCYGDGNLCFIANDWHTALVPVYLQAYYRDHGLMKYTRAVLVIHNIAHQGRGPLLDFSYLGLPDHYLEKFRLYDPIGGEHMNVFMAGLLTAHRIVAVSHGYAWECQTQEGGWGLDGVVRENNWKLRGIVNGIDDKEWNPGLDAHLKSDGYKNYSLSTLDSGKSFCKAALQRELGLPVRSDFPMLGFIGRLDHQKGVDIIADAMHWLMGQDLQLIMLGSGRSDLENLLRSFEGQYRHKVRGWVGFSVKTAHRMTAGCDILLMPSRFEPCGLNQLYAMRYGTVPVVHAVGGLRDTVKTFDPYSNTGTGWTFERADPNTMISALGNALWTYRDFKDSWKGIQERGMSQDLSWDNAAKQYEEVLVAAKYQW